jgi:hypothetical protein
MPWVRFDDTFPMHRKVEGLSDAAFRLHVSAVFWCARNLTDGFVPEEDLDLVTARVRTPARFAAELVRRGLWHRAEAVTRNGDVDVTRNATVGDYRTGCESTDCPVAEGPGWAIHDYLEFQPSKDKVREEQSKNADRQRRYRERQAAKKQVNGGEDGSRNGVTNASRDASDDASQDRHRNGVSNGEQTPPRPDPNTEEANASSGGAAKPRKRKDDPIWDALMVACAVDTTQIPTSSRGAYNNAVKDLKAIGATPAQITLRARRYRSKWPTASLTPTALVRRWPELDTGAGAPVSEAETERCPKHKRQPATNCQICDSERRGAA